MSTDFADIPVGKLVRDQVGRSRVMERFGIDYCCGGDRPLAEACQEAGVSLDDVCRELRALDDAPPVDETDWSTASLADLAEHIVQRHHTYLGRELPRIEQLIERVVAAHGASDPRLTAVQQVFRRLQDELVLHMAKEERVLFPIAVEMEKAAARGQALPGFHCGSVNNPISVMEDEHRDAGDALAALRKLTDSYAVPAGACETYRALLAALAELEADLHLHIHKENNILFPRTAQLESELMALAR